MKTKVITLHTPQAKEDLTYVKYYKSEDLSYGLRKTPKKFNVETELQYLRNQAISQSIDGKIISTSSRFVSSPSDFCPLEEVTINYE